MVTKLATDLEQSRKLLKLGISPETADMGWYGPVNPYVPNTQKYLYTKYTDNAELPAWSLEALLRLMPENIFPDNGSNQVYKMQVYNYDSLYCTDYVGEIDGDSIEAFVEESYIDAAFKMVVWLIEQYYVKINKE